MNRASTAEALRWGGSVFVVVGVIALCYAFLSDGSPETFLRSVGVAIGLLLVPGGAAIVAATHLSTPPEGKSARDPSVS